MMCEKCLFYEDCKEEREEETKEACKYYIYDVIKYD